METIITEKSMRYNLPIVALVGPPNVGKSTLLNKIAGMRLAVTSDLPGTTRDRQYVETGFAGKNFMLVDTAGLDLSARGELEKNVQKQIEVALKEATVIVLIVDGQKPPGAIDPQVLVKFRKLKKPKILAVNKLDSPAKREIALAAFSRLGIKPIFGISAITGGGIGDMLEYLAKTLAPAKDSMKPSPPPAVNTGQSPSISVCIVGKPNVGKSSIFNKILNNERAVVSAVPGTTRTSIDEEVIIDGICYTFIDTAGLRKKAYRAQQPDIYSGFQTFKSIRRSDVCLLVVDATSPITMQDKKIAQEIVQMQKGCIIVANKIDKIPAVEDGRDPSRSARAEANRTLQDYISYHFPFLWMCPVFFVSALTGEGLSEALKTIKPIYDRRNKKIDNQTLSEFLSKKLKQQPPKRLKDQKNPKVFALHQTGVNPPTFTLKVNFPAAISQHFRHFLENSIIRELDFWGTPVKLQLIRKIGA